MSNIPNSAMPHAKSQSDGNDGQSGQQKNEAGEKTTMSDRAGKIADVARDNPKTAIAAGAAIVAGVVAAAAIPMVRSRKKTSEKGSSGSSSKSSSSKSSSSKSSGSKSGNSKDS
jgi:hypothetical protein